MVVTAVEYSRQTGGNHATAPSTVSSGKSGFCPSQPLALGPDASREFASAVASGLASRAATIPQRQVSRRNGQRRGIPAVPPADGAELQMAHRAHTQCEFSVRALAAVPAMARQ